MSSTSNSISSGILRSLKNLIFEDIENTSSEVSTTPKIEETLQKTPENIATSKISLANNKHAESDLKLMKIKVLNILEQLNQPNVDFFEVWNAAADMGEVNGNTLKAAYTSLKYIDKNINKAILLSSGEKYIDEINKIIDQESSQKQLEKQRLENALIDEKEKLANEIKSIEQNIKELKITLQTKENELNGIHAKYDPQLRDIDQKIALGNAAVAEVVTDIKKALNFIETNIN